MLIFPYRECGWVGDSRPVRVNCLLSFRMWTFLLPPIPFEKWKWGIKTGLVRRRRILVCHDWKKAYISEGIKHRNLKLKLWSLCKNSVSKMLLDFRLPNWAN